MINILIKYVIWSINHLLYKKQRLCKNQQSKDSTISETTEPIDPFYN